MSRRRKPTRPSAVRPRRSRRARRAGRSSQVGGGVLRDVLERREVLDPRREVEELAEHPDHEADAEERPRQRAGAGARPISATVSPTSTQTAGAIRERADDRLPDRVGVAGDRGVGRRRTPRPTTTSTTSVPPNATARWLAANRSTRHRRRQDLLGVRRRLLAADPQRRLDREAGARRAPGSGTTSRGTARRGCRGPARRRCR